MEDTSHAYMVVVHQDYSRTSRLFVSVRKLIDYLNTIDASIKFMYQPMKDLLRIAKKHTLIDSIHRKITIERVTLHV